MLFILKDRVNKIIEKYTNSSIKPAVSSNILTLLAARNIKTKATGSVINAKLFIAVVFLPLTKIAKNRKK